MEIVFEILKIIWPFLLGGGIFLLGMKYAKDRQEKKELKAEIEQQKNISKAQDKVIELEKYKEKKLGEIDEVFKTGSPNVIADFANKLFSSVFKPPSGKDTK